MNLAICSLASGSSGNCYLIKSNNAAILVDAGISARQIVLRLEKLGLSLSDIDAVFITHEHSDHTKGIKPLSKSENIRFCSSEGSFRNLGIEVDESRFEFIKSGDSLMVGDILVRCFSLSHDAAEPTGYSFSSGNALISIVTDTGTVTDEIYSSVNASDILVLESNHDVNILKMGRYPWFLKQRILSDQGHLSNEAAAELLCRIGKECPQKKRLILLAHLSKENNFPEMAMATSVNILEAIGMAVGKEFRLAVLSRDEASPLYTV